MKQKNTLQYKSIASKKNVQQELKALKAVSRR